MSCPYESEAAARVRRLGGCMGTQRRDGARGYEGGARRAWLDLEAGDGGGHEAEDEDDES